LLDKLKANGPAVRQIGAALAYLEQLYPTSIGEACVIDRSGHEVARVVFGKHASFADLSPDESGNPFFKPTFAMPAGVVYQAPPYVSPDTGEWVISNSTVVPSPDGHSRAFFHFEVGIESFRRAAAESHTARLLVLAPGSGRIVIDAAVPQRKGKPLGRKASPSLTRLVAAGDSRGRWTAAGSPSSRSRRRTGTQTTGSWRPQRHTRSAGDPARSAGRHTPSGSSQLPSSPRLPCSIGYAGDGTRSTPA